jgi:predicted DCC family thiol-disulfide oxidoreductase YuxK
MQQHSQHAPDLMYAGEGHSRKGTDAPIVLFDGVCGLCDASVNFVIDHDAVGRFRFAPLQSDLARQLLLKYRLDPADMTSIIMLEGGRVYSRSTAILRICRGLHFPLPLASWFIVIPPPIRDMVYDWVARNRYHWFGKFDACRMPAPGVAARFLA